MSPIRRLAKLPGRLKAWLNDDTHVRSIVAVSIALVSVVGAIVAWQATLASEDANRMDSTGMQELTQQVQIEAQLEAMVDEDSRIFTLYREHVNAAALLSADAERVRVTDPSLATSLDAQAQGETTLARTMQANFQAVTVGPDDTTFDRSYVLQYAIDHNTDLQKLNPKAAFARGKVLHVRAVMLIGLVAVFVAALLFLALAQLSRAQLRPMFANVGFAVTFVGVAIWALIQANVT